MSDEQKVSKIRGLISIFSSFVKRLVLVITNPKTALLKIKDSPNILPIIVVPLLLIVLTFLRYYILFKVKLVVPEFLFSPQIERFMSSMVQFQVFQYTSYLFFGIVLTLLFFMLVKWIGGYGEWTHNASVIGYSYAPNLIGLLILVSLFLSFPTVETGLVNYIGHPYTDKAFFSINLDEYVGKKSNLTVTVCAEYKIPLNTTKCANNTLKGQTRITRGEVNFTYVVMDTEDFNMSSRIVQLDNMSLDYNIPVVLRDIDFNLTNHCTDSCANKFTVNMIMFLNNTYLSPVEDNISIPYVIFLNIFYPNGIKSYEINSSLSAEILQLPDAEPFVEMLVEKTSSHILELFLTIVVFIWQAIILTMALVVIHEFSWKKSVSIITVCILIKIMLIGLTM